MTFYDRLIRALLLRRRHSSGLRTEESRRAFLRTIVLGGVALPFAPGALERIALSSGRPSNVELLRLMGSGDYITAQAAREAFAAFMSQPILQVIENDPVVKELFVSELFVSEPFQDWTCTPIGAPVIPLDLTWGTPEPSNLPHSEVVSTFHHGRGRPR